MTADYAALEARVAELERQLRHILPAKLDGLSYGINLVHEDTRAIRGTLARQDETLARHGDRLGELTQTLARQGGTPTRHGEMLTEHGALLQEILRRLPAPPDA